MPLVSLTVVAPGPVKDSPLIRRVFAEADAEATHLVREVEGWPIWVREEVDEPTGPELLLAVDAEPGDLKRAMVRLEESHPWGRLFDLDVLDDAGGLRIITRAMVGEPPRRCLVCEEPSVVCARSRAHALEDLSAAVAALVDG